MQSAQSIVNASGAVCGWFGLTPGIETGTADGTAVSGMAWTPRFVDSLVFSMTQASCSEGVTDTFGGDLSGSKHDELFSGMGQH
jgi:hypothetical protein